MMQYAQDHIPDSTPRPGEIAADVIQVGYLRGYIVNGHNERNPGTSRSYLDDALMSDFEGLEGVTSAGVENLKESLKPKVRERDRANYTERHK